MAHLQITETDVANRRTRVSRMWLATGLGRTALRG
jgi:hypothetical protein